MPLLLHPCKSSISNPCPTSDNNSFTCSITNQSRILVSLPICPLAKNLAPKFSSLPVAGSPKILPFSKKFPFRRRVLAPFCSKNEVYDQMRTTRSRGKPIGEAKNGGIDEVNGLELLGKPAPKQMEGDGFVEPAEEPTKADPYEVLEPFYRFFRQKDSEEESDGEEGDGRRHSVGEESGGEVTVEYYEPKPGDFVVGVVVSGNENKLDVNIGADLLGTMLTKEVLPLYDKEMGFLLCDLGKDAEEFMVRGKMGIVKYDDALSEELTQGRPVVEPGTVLFAEVLGRTLSGRPLLSTRKLFRRVAWHRLRQIKQLNEPIAVKITEWNTGGLLTRIEGLRAFLPKAELMNRVNNFTELKANVGRWIYVLITRINEDTNDLILSERDAWEMLHLREGTVLQGTVRKIFPYGAQIRIGETNRSGLLHISNITQGKITSVGDLLAVDEKVKVLVVKSLFPGKISLSIADLESEPGLFTSNKERVFSEAEEMAKKYRKKLPLVSLNRKLELAPADSLPCEESFYANWKWFKFEKGNGLS